VGLTVAQRLSKRVREARRVLAVAMRGGHFDALLSVPLNAARLSTPMALVEALETEATELLAGQYPVIVKWAGNGFAVHLAPNARKQINREES
jgi:hypothetical protein